MQHAIMKIQTTCHWVDQSLRYGEHLLCVQPIASASNCGDGMIHLPFKDEGSVSSAEGDRD